MNQSFDAFASLLEPPGSAPEMDCIPSPATPVSMTERSGVVTFLPSSNSTTSMDSCVELQIVPSYPAVAPPPSPTASRNVSASLMTTRGRAAWKTSLLEARAAAAATEGTLPQTLGDALDLGLMTRRYGFPQTIPEHGLPLERDDSLTKIFFSPHSEDESLAGRMPGRSSHATFRVMSPFTTTQTSSDNVASSPSPPRSPPSAARVRNLSLRSARRRSAARRAIRAAASAINAPLPATPSPSEPPPTSPAPPQSPPLALGRGATGRCGPPEGRTVSSPLTSPDTSSASSLSLATRSPSPCASNMSNDVKRRGVASGFTELNYYRRNLILRESEKNKAKVSFSRRDSEESIGDSDKLRKEGQEDKEGEGTEKEKSKPEKSAEEEKRASALGSSRKKSSRRRRNRRFPEISGDEQAMRDEISYLRTEYLPKLLAEAEADSVSKTGCGPKAGVKRYAGARPRDALLLRAGLLPAHLSPWRRSLQAQMRKREESRRKEAQTPSAARLLPPVPRTTTPERLRGVAPPASPATAPDKLRSPMRFYVERSGSQSGSPNFQEEQNLAARTEVLLKAPQTVSFVSNNSTEVELTPTHTADTNSFGVARSVSSPTGSVTYSHLPRLFDPALMSVLRKRSSEFVLETKRVPPPQQEQAQTRRYLTLLSTAGVQRRAAEEQRRRRRGEGAHEMWARRARQIPRPLVGSIFDRKPFYGAPGPNCNPLPWLR